VAAGINAEGRLLLSTDNGVQAVSSGELSLRPADA
jgi:biotin-(acetyl-CoA carboxylase) ligase